MFKLEVQNIGKRYRLEWIFKEVNYSFESGSAYAVLGANGTGKSTLLQILGGSLLPTSGKVNYQLNGQPIESTDAYQYMSIAAPYLELIEEFSLLELVKFQLKFKPFIHGLGVSDIIEHLQLSHAQHKRIAFYSSGMKQRVKMGLAVLSASPLVLLDEPTANLDAKACEWYLDLVERYAADKLLIIASNQPTEYQFCRHQLNITDYSPKL